MNLEYWFKSDENLCDYESNLNDGAYIELRRINFLIGPNNSGKSRFMRSLFLQKDFAVRIKDGNFEGKISNKITKSVVNYSAMHTASIDFDGKIIESNSSKIKEDVLAVIKKYIDWNVVFTPIRNRHKNISGYGHEPKTVLESKLNTLQVNYSNRSAANFRQIAIDNFPAVDEKFSNIKKKYVPVLRGMRPLNNSEDNDLYKKRTIVDYFNDVKDIDQKIITGEDFYDLLTERLLGSPTDRDLIYKYQDLLSRYFFDNSEITLIPKYKSDVVHIKIGDAEQFPIYMLGDGLQQAIILTFDAFLHKNEIIIYHIEEPELHLHPGMVRQLMNFFLIETQHIYYFTTHSNHIIDMINESPNVGMLKFRKNNDKKFELFVCDRDRELLDTLGVRPSSVYFSNCSVWIEGITDRLYLNKYMEKFIEEMDEFLSLSEKDKIRIFDERKYQSILNKKIKQNSTNYIAEIGKLVSGKRDSCRRLMQNLHYSFVEYQGANLIHWNFDEEFGGNAMKARALTSGMLLIADGDVADKKDRIAIVRKALGADSVIVVSCKEIENTLPGDLIIQAAKNRYARMTKKIKDKFDIEKLNDLNLDYFFNEKKYGIGKLLDDKCLIKKTSSNLQLFSANDVGTIDKKTDFCHEVIGLMDSKKWTLTPYGRELTSKIFNHIELHN